MTSEYEQGPELFDTPQPVVVETSQERKSPRRIIRRRVLESSAQQVVVKVKQSDKVPSEPIVATMVEQPQLVVEKPPVKVEEPQQPVKKRRGRPPRAAKEQVKEPAAVVDNPKEISIPPVQEEKPKSEPSVAAASEPAVVVSPAPSPSNGNVINSAQPKTIGQSQYGNRQRNQQNHNANQRNNRQKQHQKNNYQQRSPNKNQFPQVEEIPVDQLEENPDAPRITVNDLSMMNMHALRQKAAEYGLSEDFLQDLKKQEIIVEILKAHTASKGVIFAYGSLEILPDGYGFLRSPQNNYLSGPEDIYISPSQIKLFNLKTGDTVEGQIRSPRDAERFFAMMRVQTINYDTPAVAKTRVSFDSLTPLYPDVRLNLETEEGDISTRIINLFCPIGKGQRSLIVAPPRAGKTILMQKIANAISANHPEVYLMVLLIDERPEEVTDMRRTVHGEVIASTFDEQATRHVSVAEMVIEKAKRLVEHKRDVVILLDNITRLARAYNQTVPASGKILSGGVDSNALHKPKRFLGAARNIEHGGSLTIIASALIETGSRMDEVIFEEFKGTGNNEIVLDRRMSERRLFPALNIKKSGTRREDLLLTAEENAKIWALRNAINPMDDIEMTELLIDKMKKTKNNEAFLRSMNTGVV
ncbi:MAG: transcription termination factor Rho [Sphaerochaetaceae bacterium]|jgi:transcription termination factor Rho|nr:transcription termination factor Rho [Sphaerochaetaceae bacterium]MDX9808573.1 transcription termination factor Rho [Sphaerochaetaceae bacterium]